MEHERLTDNFPATVPQSPQASTNNNATENDASKHASADEAADNASTSSHPSSPPHESNQPPPAQPEPQTEMVDQYQGNASDNASLFHPVSVQEPQEPLEYPQMHGLRDIFSPNGRLTEFLATLVSFVCFGAIVGILIHFNGRQIPRLARGITLNGLIAFVTTVARSLVLVPVSSGIGQLKWIWLAQRQRGAFRGRRI